MAGRIFDYATVWREDGCPLPVPACVAADGAHKGWSESTFRQYIAQSLGDKLPNELKQQLFISDVEALLRSNAPNRYGTTPRQPLFPASAD